MASTSVRRILRGFKPAFPEALQQQHHDGARLVEGLAVDEEYGQLAEGVLGGHVLGRLGVSPLLHEAITNGASGLQRH